MANYLFSSERLGFRDWAPDDLEPFAAMNNDNDVMEFFPSKPTKEDTKKLIERMQAQLTKNGFCYFAVDVLETKEFIGFIGLCEQTYLEDTSPFVDIGWRLKKSAWYKGYATEGARASLDFGFTTIGLSAIYSVAPEINIKSIVVMEKIGMQKIKTFKHPKLLDDKRLVNCVLYQISKNQY